MVYCGLGWCGIFGNPQTGPHNKCCRMCVPLPMRKNWGDFGEVCQGSGINNEGQQGCYSDCFFFSRPLPGKGFLKLNSFLRAMKCLCWHAWFLEMLNFFFHFIHRLIGSKSFLCLSVRELFLCCNPLQYFLSRFLVP